MNSNNHLNPINYSDTPNVLLLGNGVNRAFDMGSWSDLLDDMSCNNIEAVEVFKKSRVIMWECCNCGHVVAGTEVSEICPICNQPQSFFEDRAEKY